MGQIEKIIKDGYLKMINSEDHKKKKNTVISIMFNHIVDNSDDKRYKPQFLAGTSTLTSLIIGYRGVKYYIAETYEKCIPVGVEVEKCLR
jgi:hypothetical protein